jgi:preprotein translocase subunit SecE
MANPFQFLQQVRSEASKVTWPTRRETLITTGLVIVRVFIASIFFLVVDWTIKEALGLLLNLVK